MAVSVREKPPLRLDFSAEVPSGQSYHWSDQEVDPRYAPRDVSFSTVIPGGFETFEATLPRKPQIVYSDLERLTTIRAQGPGRETAWEGRLERAPRVSGSEFSVAPSAVGWQAHLEDDKSAREIYVDADISHWEDPSVQRKINLTAAGNAIFDHSSDSDVTTGAPALRTALTGAWAIANAISEARYDAGSGCRLGSIFYAWKRGTNMTAGPDNFFWQAIASTDDVLSGFDNTGDLQAAGPGSGTLSTTTSTRRFAMVQASFAGAGGAEGADYDVFWTQLAVYGNHGLTKQGTASATAHQGFYASDVVANAVSRWAPMLAYSTGAEGTIKPTAFVIPQLEFRDPTTAAEILKQANRFHLNDWAVWEGPTFHFYERGAIGKRWRARVGPSGLEETGPQVDRLWNGVVVTYRDVDGTTKTVGPTGVSADATDANLIDTDSLNPANQLGIKRYAILDMGIVSTSAAAIEVGRRFLTETKALDTSGKADLVGHVEDDKGVTHAAWKVRAGDYISFIDAADTSYRRITKASYEHGARTNTVDLDSPPEGMEALLERLGVVLVGLGLS